MQMKMGMNEKKFSVCRYSNECTRHVSKCILIFILGLVCSKILGIIRMLGMIAHCDFSKMISRHSLVLRAKCFRELLCTQVLRRLELKKQINLVLGLHAWKAFF